MVKEMLGHKGVATTQAYIGVNYVDVRDAVEAMSLTAEDNPTDPLDAFDEDTLIAKVIKLGYTVAKRKDTENTRHATQ